MAKATMVITYLPYVRTLFLSDSLILCENTPPPLIQITSIPPVVEAFGCLKSDIANSAIPTVNPTIHLISIKRHA